MYAKPRSLRAIADKWLALRPDTQVHVKRVAQGRARQRRCVYIRTTRSAGKAGEVGMFFFRHDDGNWYIFPPHEYHPAMGMVRAAA
jgi:hypothetical protein